MACVCVFAVCSQVINVPQRGHEHIIVAKQAMSVSILTQHSVGHNKQHVVLDLAAFTVCVSAVTSRGKLHTRSLCFTGLCLVSI